jgi:23S rRNA pseudouridine1911/1915/1917 synthase
VPADESNRPLLQRQALHAWKLQFVHPRTLRRMELQAPLPEDIRNLLALLESPS